MQTEEHKKLKQMLLEKNISFEDVRNKLLELDQNDIYRTAAESNLDFLTDPEILKYIENSSDIDKEFYHNFLSLTEFHVGQRLVEESKDVALNHFKNALDSSEKCKDQSCSWTNYIKGTICYLEGNKIDEEIICAIEESNNANILQNFNHGLKTRGYPSYMEDYTK